MPTSSPAENVTVAAVEKEVSCCCSPSLSEQPFVHKSSCEVPSLSNIPSPFFYCCSQIRYEFVESWMKLLLRRCCIQVSAYSVLTLLRGLSRIEQGGTNIYLPESAG